MPYCFNKRSIIMASSAVVILCLVLYVAFGAAYPSVVSNPKSAICHEDPDKELKLLHLVFRHGPRTPADTYPNDVFINEKFFPFGWGQLTTEGKKMLFNTGKSLRKKYDSFLGQTYTPDILHAQATGVSRALMSCASVLAGMWPPKNTPTEWNNKLNWQPIPIFSEPLDKDTLLLVRTACPRFYEALDEVMTRPEIQIVLKEHESLFKELTQITGQNISNPDDVQSLYSTLRAEEEYGLKLPSWTKDYYPEKLQPLTELSYLYNIYTDELKKLKGGPFISKMINEWKMKRENTLKPTDRKLYVYTGHDSTVVNILSSLNVWEQQIPVYGIMGIFELLKDKKTDEYGVQIYLRNSTVHEPYPLTIPGCNFFCPLDKVIKLTEAIIPTENQCKSENPNYSTPPPSGP